MSTLKRAIFVCASILVIQVLGRLAFLVSTTRSARIQEDRPWSGNLMVVQEPRRQSADSVDLLALFYNVFVPVLDEESDGESNDVNNHTVHALEIVREHLIQMGTLFNHMQRTNRTRQAHLPVHFVTIGNPKTVLAIRQMCPSPLACLHAGHYDAGFEEVTLQALYDYCADHARARIIYLHNKGSFHPDFVGAGRKNISQNAWRRHGTDGAMHPDCLDPPDPRCNMCGLYVEVVPVIRQPGNFWSASCEYVQKLIPPNQFALAQDAMYEELLETQKLMNDHDDSPRRVVRQLQERQQKQQQQRPLLHDASFWVPRPASLGLGRYANEVWIGSHPDVIPCDVSSATSFSLHKTDADDRIPALQFGMLPKRTFDEIVQYDEIGIRERKHHVMQNETLRKRDFFLLPGLIFKSAFLYRSLPSNTSWVFDQYPDGPYWRRKVEQMRLELELEYPKANKSTPLS